MVWGGVDTKQPVQKAKEKKNHKLMDGAGKIS